jgi:hypothetical protein
VLLEVFDEPLVRPSARRSDARCAGDEAGSVFCFPDGVDGDDFWKKPKMDF